MGNPVPGRTLVHVPGRFPGREPGPVPEPGRVHGPGLGRVRDQVHDRVHDPAPDPRFDPGRGPVTGRGRGRGPDPCPEGAGVERSLGLNRGVVLDRGLGHVPGLAEDGHGLDESRDPGPGRGFAGDDGGVLRLGPGSGAGEVHSFDRGDCQVPVPGRVRVRVREADDENPVGGPEVRPGGVDRRGAQKAQEEAQEAQAAWVAAGYGGGEVRRLGTEEAGEAWIEPVFPEPPEAWPGRDAVRDAAGVGGRGRPRGAVPVEGGQLEQGGVPGGEPLGNPRRAEGCSWPGERRSRETVAFRESWPERLLELAWTRQRLEPLGWVQPPREVREVRVAGLGPRLLLRLLQQ